jgi:hypothetical protein
MPGAAPDYFGAMELTHAQLIAPLVQVRCIFRCIAFSF